MSEEKQMFSQATGADPENSEGVGGGREKRAHISRRHHWFHREMRSEKRAQTLDLCRASH